MKVLKRIFATILIISIMLSSVMCITASASSSTYKEHVSCVNEHFAWMQHENDLSKEERIPSNDVGNCPFVAMSLLLSYYDAYWHDDFVPDDIVPDDNVDNNLETMGVIDTNTGEIVKDFNLKLENEDWTLELYGINSLEELTDEIKNSVDTTSAESRAKYGNFVENNANNFFNLYLTSLAMNSNFEIYDMLNIYGLTAMQMVSVLEYYLYDVRGFTEEQVTVNKMSALLPDGRYGMFNKATELINDGFPVLYCGLETSLDNLLQQNPATNVDNIAAGHVLVGHRSENSDIVLSPCWNEHDNQMFSTTTFKYISSIIWLEINEEAFPHVCSTSYVDANDPNRTFCTCEIYRNHPNHVDSINNGAELCPVASENAICLCGRSMTGTHRYYMRQYNEYKHWFECPCGASTEKESHDKTYYSGSTATHHSGYCNCGYIFLDQPHSFNYTKLDVSKHTSKCDCGYQITEGHTFESMLLGYKCRYCGFITKNIMVPIANIKPGTDLCDENEQNDN